MNQILLPQNQADVQFLLSELSKAYSEFENNIGADIVPPGAVVGIKQIMHQLENPKDINSLDYGVYMLLAFLPEDRRVAEALGYSFDDGFLEIIRSTRSVCLSGLTAAQQPCQHAYEVAFPSLVHWVWHVRSLYATQ